MTNDISKKTKKSLYWNISLKIPFEIFRFFASIVTARFLDPQDFGIVSIATMVIYYSNSFGNFGFNQALIQRKEIEQRHVNTVFTFDLCFSLILGIVIYFLSSPISNYFNSPESSNVIKVLSVIFILTTFHDLPYVLIRRDIEYKTLALVDMAREVSMSIITMVLAYIGFKYWSIVIGHIVPLFFAAAYLMYKTKYSIKLKYDFDAIKELFGFSKWSFLQMQVYFLSSRIDRILIGRFINTTMLGTYEKSKSLSQMASEGLGEKITSVLFSSFSRSQDDKQGIKNLFNKGAVIISIITFPIYFGLYAVADHFVIILLGEKWELMIMTFKIMAVAGLFASLNGLITSLAVGVGFYRGYVVRFTISLIAFFIGGLAYVDYGIEAVAIVFVFYTMFLFILGMKLVTNIIEGCWSGMFFSVIPPLIAGIVMTFCVELMKYYYLYEYTLINLVLMILFGGVVFTLIMLIYPSKMLDIIRQPFFNDLNKVYLKLKELRK